jgi:tRNA G18 (ribose-2'-O)-methylase SpoU
MLTKRKFLLLPIKERHKVCAEILREQYEKTTKDLAYYNTLANWLSLNPYEYSSAKELANRYHWHLQKAGLSLKEHHLLPNLRTRKSSASRDFSNIAIYLDQVRSAYNVGNILRTVEALRLGGVYFSPNTPFIDDEKVQKISQGSANIVPVFRDAKIQDLPRPLVALDTSDAAVSVFDFEFPKSFTLILGNEEHGVSDEVLEEIDHIVEVPLFGEKNSINVACAFSIAAATINQRFLS